MKKRLFIFLFVCILFTQLTGCDMLDNGAQKDPADAYYLVFQDLYRPGDALNDKIKYIAIDMNDTLMTDPAPFLAQVEEFCRINRLTLLLDTYDGLCEKGYISDLYFEEGILFSFHDTKLTDRTLQTKGEKWRSGLGAIGATYTLKRTNGSWEISNTEDNWIS